MRKTVSYKEQILSKDKYPSIVLLQMEAIVFIIVQIFLATCTVLKIGEYSRIFPSFSWEIFSHVMCLDQLRVSENIWSIIMWVDQVWVKDGWILVKFFFACFWFELESRFINTQKKSRPISSHLDQTSLVDKRFIKWKKKPLFLVGHSR